MSTWLAGLPFTSIQPRWSCQSIVRQLGSAVWPYSRSLHRRTAHGVAGNAFDGSNCGMRLPATNSMLPSESLHDSLAAVEPHALPVLHDLEQAGNADHRRDAELPREDGGVRQRAAALDQDAGGAREQRRPAGIGAHGGEDLAVHREVVARVAHHAQLALAHAGAAAEAAEHAAVAWRVLGLAMRHDRLAAVHGSDRLEVVRELLALVPRKFRLAQAHEPGEVGGDRRALLERDQLVGAQVEDVARRIEHARLVQPLADRGVHVAVEAHHARAGEARVLALAHALARLAQRLAKASARAGPARCHHLALELLAALALGGVEPLDGEVALGHVVAQHLHDERRVLP